MFTSITLSTRIVLDLVDYSVNATWRDDPDAEAVYMTRSGSVRLNPFSEPEDIISACLAALRAERASA